MAEMDQEFVEYVVKSLVSKPEAVEVNRKVDEMGVLLELKVDPADMGKVIGKAGATAKSIRTLLRVLGAKNDARVNLKIVEPEGSTHPSAMAAQENAPAAESQDSPSFGSAQDKQDEPIAAADVADTIEAPGAEPSVAAQTKKELEELADLDI